MEPFSLTEKQTQTIIKYIKERRYPFMISLYGIIGFLIFTLPVLLMDITMLQYDERRKEIAGAVSVIGQMARHYHRSRPGEFIVFWVAGFVVLLVMVLRNYGITFGKGCDLDCIRRGMYTIETASFAGKSDDTGKHPYFFYDADGKAFKCPVFLDWKRAGQGTQIVFVTLSNGKGYAVLPESDTPRKEWWEEDPY